MAKGKKKKVNPRNKPATMADVNRAKRKAQEDAIRATWAIFFSVMRDKEGYGAKRLVRLWDRVNYLSECVAEGYVSIADLEKTLEEEAGITLGAMEDERS